MNTYTYLLTPNKAYEGKVAPLVLRQGDYGQVISVQVTCDGDEFNLAGLKPYFCARMNDHVINDPASITGVIAGKFEYTVTSNLTKYAGKTYGYFELSNTRETYSTEDIPIMIEKEGT